MRNGYGGALPDLANPVLGRRRPNALAPSSRRRTDHLVEPWSRLPRGLGTRDAKGRTRERPRRTCLSATRRSALPQRFHSASTALPRDEYETCSSAAVMSDIPLPKRPPEDAPGRTRTCDPRLRAVPARATDDVRGRRIPPEHPRCGRSGRVVPHGHPDRASDVWATTGPQRRGGRVGAG